MKPKIKFILVSAIFIIMIIILSPLARGIFDKSILEYEMRFFLENNITSTFYSTSCPLINNYKDCDIIWFTDKNDGVYKAIKYKKDTRIIIKNIW